MVEIHLDKKCYQIINMNVFGEFINPCNISSNCNFFK